MIYNDFCESKNCPFYIEWEYQFDSYHRPYPCVSCEKVGQSYDINKYPADCKFINEIKKFKEEK